MLRLSETNCDSKGHNLTLALKDRRALLPGQDVALMTVLGFAGVVGLTCAGLVIFNWKLRQGRANERTSKNLHSRTHDESRCAREDRNSCAVGCCNCHLTRENETKVMPHVGLGKEIPHRQESSHQAGLASKSTALDASLRKLKGRDHGADSACSCLGDSLLQARCLGSPGNKKSLYDASLVTRCAMTAEKLSNLKHGEVQTQILPQHGTRKIDVSSGTFRSRHVTSASALARESLGKLLTDKPWQPPIGKGENAAQPPGQRLFITSSSSKLWEPEGNPSHRHRGGCNGHCGLLEQRKPMDVHPDTSTCKYVSWNEFQDCMKGKKPRHRARTKSEKEQIQISRAIEKFLRTQGKKDKSKLSSKIKKSCSTKRLKFHDPDLVGGNRLVMSAETPASRKQLESESRYPTVLYLKNCTSLEEVKEPRGWLPEQQVLKKKRVKQFHPSEKGKGRKLRIKLDLHPFGKARVHPEESPQELPKRHKQTGLHPKKAARTSERKFKATPMYLLSSQLPDRSSRAQLACSKVPLESAPQHTPYQERNGPHRADSLSVDHVSSVHSGCCPVGHIPNGSSSTVRQSTARIAEHQCPHPPFSPVQAENTTQQQTEAMGPAAAHLRNEEGSVSLPQHAIEPTDHVVMVLTQYTDQDKLKINELNKFTLPPCYQVIDTYRGDHSLGKNHTLQQEEQKLSHEQLGSEEKPLVSKSKILHQSVESHIMDGEGNGRGNKSPCIEDSDSSPTAWIHPHNNLALRRPPSALHPKRTALLKEICSSPTRRQEGKADTENASLGDNHGVAPGIQGWVTEHKQALDERKTNSSSGSHMTQMGTTDERQQPREGKGKEKLASCYPSSDKETVSVKDLSKGKPGTLQSEADSSSLNHESHCRDPGDKHPDIGAHRDNAGAVGMPGASYLSWELNTTHSEAGNGMPLIPNRENRTENPACKAASHPPSPGDSNPPLLEVEGQRQQAV
ncbi:Leucine-rich repeat-containing protein 53 [Lemmus lemmus]